MLVRITTFFILIVMLAGCATTIPQSQHIRNKCKHAIRFATYNVYWQNNSKNKHNPHSVIRIIHDIDPDIIILQETYCFSQDHLANHFKKSHPYQLFRHYDYEDNEDGLGILSRFPIIKNIYFPPRYGWFPGWLYVIKTPYGLLQVLNVHLNPKLVSQDNIGIFAEGLWLTGKFRLLEISYYYQYLNPTLPTIIAGDFNENDYGAAGNFLRSHHFKDQLLYLPITIKTWHCKFACFTFTGRYDRIFTSCGIYPFCLEVIKKGYSDHFPVLMDFNINRMQK